MKTTPTLGAVFLLFYAGALVCSAAQPTVADTYYRTYSAKHPVLKRIRPGETVATKTICTGGMDENGVKRSEPGNPLTGPFFIEGAEPGDALIIRFTRMRMNRTWGFTRYRLGLFALTPEAITTLYPDRYKKDFVVPGRENLLRWEIDREKQTVRLGEPVSAVMKFEFPAKPMLGCVGVAPEGDFAPTSTPSGSYGGNLDYNEIGEGSIVMLPVYHPGALLFIGDGHALQADGEPTGTGIETSLDVEFTAEIRKQANLSGPRVEIADYIISIGSQPEFVSSLDRSIRMATSDMVSWLVDDYKLEPWAAHMLIGYQGKYDVVTVAGSMALKIPQEIPAAETVVRKFRGATDATTKEDEANCLDPKPQGSGPAAPNSEFDRGLRRLRRYQTKGTDWCLYPRHLRNPRLKRLVPYH